MNKDDIRRQVRARKLMLDNREKEDAAQRVFNALQSMAAFAMAQNVLMYHSLPDELSTIDFLDRFSAVKNFFLPRVNGVDLDILPYQKSRTHLGAFHIEEPDGDESADLDDIDLIIVPAVAYDRHGNRLGRGKGYYDRLLSRSKALKIGVCYDFQLVDQIDSEPHDIPVDFIIADRHGIIRALHEPY